MIHDVYNTYIYKTLHHLLYKIYIIVILLSYGRSCLWFFDSLVIISISKIIHYYYYHDYYHSLLFDVLVFVYIASHCCGWCRSHRPNNIHDKTANRHATYAYLVLFFEHVFGWCAECTIYTEHIFAVCAKIRFFGTIIFLIIYIHMRLRATNIMYAYNMQNGAIIIISHLWIGKPTRAKISSSFNYRNALQSLFISPVYTLSINEKYEYDNIANIYMLIHSFCIEANAIAYHQKKPLEFTRQPDNFIWFCLYFVLFKKIGIQFNKHYLVSNRLNILQCAGYRF